LGQYLTDSEKMTSNKKEKETNKNRFREEVQIFVCFISGAVQIFIRVCISFLTKIGICTLPKSPIRVQWQALAVGSLTLVELSGFGTCMMDTLPSEI